ncbi:hypothetical protein IFM89_022362 [Coptis chinensis]|uniref:Uncharacterized protein n=1 Tax=Coptis chinensis TaxID=261450 RepID=A0A835H018_9MAGN|nr:hypothetical protein IFM89_022362 [Coptis chinensis]
MPINLPGTLFNKSMKARKEPLIFLPDPLQALTDEQITDNVIEVIFAAQDTTASAPRSSSTLGRIPNSIKPPPKSKSLYLKKKCGDEKLLNWSNTKKMPITARVIQETLRVASILSFTFREVVEDVEYHGL